MGNPWINQNVKTEYNKQCYKKIDKSNKKIQK